MFSCTVGQALALRSLVFIPELCTHQRIVMFTRSRAQRIDWVNFFQHQLALRHVQLGYAGSNTGLAQHSGLAPSGLKAGSGNISSAAAGANAHGRPAAGVRERESSVNAAAAVIVGSPRGRASSSSSGSQQPHAAPVQPASPRSQRQSILLSPSAAPVVAVLAGTPGSELPGSPRSAARARASSQIRADTAARSKALVEPAFPFYDDSKPAPLAEKSYSSKLKSQHHGNTEPGRHVDMHNLEVIL